MSTSLTARGRTGPSIKMDQNQGAVTTVPCPPKLDGPESPSSRGEVREYRQLRRKVEELVGRINGRFTDPGGDVPLHYLYRGIPPERLLAYYRLADVCLVTPLADGMNLVAKEFITAQAAGEGAGALVLSEFTGAAVELRDALPCNPFDVAGLAAAIERALGLDEDDRRRRIELMAAAVARRDVHWWTEQELATP